MRGTRLWKDGRRYLADGSVKQRWLCRWSCGNRFSIPSRNGFASTTKNVEPLNRNRAKHAYRQVCELLGVSKNLAAATRNNNVAGTSLPTQTLDVKDLKGKLVEFSFYMEKQGFSGGTRTLREGCLRALLARNANLLDPGSVREVIAREKKWGQNRRRNIINGYDSFAKFIGLSWTKPRCSIVRKIPFIPAEQEIDDLML